MKMIGFFNAKTVIMASLYCQLMVKAFGPENPSKEGKATCWKIVLTLVKVTFKELRKVRVAAKSASNFLEQTNVMCMWGVLQAHHIMEDFI